MFFQQQHRNGIHHGRGSEAKGMHFYQTIQLPELQNDELVSTLTNSLSSFFLLI